MEGIEHPLISEDISRLKIERSITPAHLRLTRPTGEIHAEHKTVKKITCLGSGFVGGKLAVTTDNSCNHQGFNDLTIIYLKGPTSAVTAYKANVEVTVVDINETRIRAWQSDTLPIYEPGLFEVVKAARDGIPANLQDLTSDLTTYDHMLKSNGISHRKRLFFSSDVETAIEEADLIFVCVNTPTKATGIGKGAAADIGFVEAATRTIARVATSNKIVVEKSTVPCKTAESIRAIVSAYVVLAHMFPSS